MIYISHPSQNWTCLHPPLHPSLILKGVNWPIESRISTKSRSQGRNQHRGGWNVLQQVGAFAHQQIHLVALRRRALVQRDPSQSCGAWQISIQRSGPGPVQPVPLEPFSVVPLEHFVHTNYVARARCLRLPQVARLALRQDQRWPTNRCHFTVQIQRVCGGVPEKRAGKF